MFFSFVIKKRAFHRQMLARDRDAILNIITAAGLRARMIRIIQYSLTLFSSIAAYNVGRHLEHVRVSFRSRYNVSIKPCKTEENLSLDSLTWQHVH